MRIFKKEKAVVELIFQHVEKSAECVRVTMDGLRAYLHEGPSDSQSAIAQVNLLEAEADQLLREIRELLYSGAYLPQIRGDIYGLMSVVDDISNKAESCYDCFHREFPEVPSEYVAELDAVLELTVECFGALEKAMRAYFGPKDKADKISKHSKRAGELESRIDEIERAITMQIFQSSMGKGEKLHLRRSVGKITNISDAIEDATDELLLLSLKSVL